MQRKHIILIHTIFWITMLFLVGLETIPLMGKITYDIIAADYLLYIVFFFALFYSFYLFIKKEHLHKKRIRVLIVFGLLFVLIINIPIAYIYILFLVKDVLILNGSKFFLEFTKYYMSFLEINFLFAMSGALMKIALLWYDNVMRQKEIEKQVILNELALLRSQINPQFLFNTLTNIKSLIEPQPERAIKSIENLSEIMSYMLYETSAEKVLLDSEIEYVNNYLKLQKVKFKQETIKFDIYGNTNGVLVPPMIFMPILEYVFSSCENSAESSVISINIIIENDTLSFEITNQLNGNKSVQKSDSGFGLDSITRCLDLQFGKNKYTLETGATNNSNSITLKINLR